MRKRSKRFHSVSNLSRKDSIKHQVYIQDDGKCRYCKCPLFYEDATLDHIVPKSRGGPTRLWNLVLCCSSCNNARGNKSVRKFQKERSPQ